MVQKDLKAQEHKVYKVCKDHKVLTVTLVTMDLQVHKVCKGQLVLFKVFRVLRALVIKVTKVFKEHRFRV